MNQLALPLTLQDYAVFESYWAAGNESLLAFLQELVVTGKGPGCWLWGGEATGKSHLLQATSVQFGNDAAYLPFDLVHAAGPGILDGLASRRLVCLDSIGLVAGDRRWELALFDLVNQLFDHDGILLVAAAGAPRDSAIVLPDLKSRLTHLPVFHVEALDEDGRVSALQLRAQHRGLDLPEKTARYLLSRSRRDMRSLYQLLDRLDSEALKAQRRLTIPFVRDVLEANNA